MITDYIRNIKVSLENKCYYAALSLALTLPDICGCAEYPNAGVTERYIKWYDSILEEFAKEQREGTSPWLSGEIIYNLRNTFLYQGSPNISNERIKENDNQLDKFVLLLGDGTVIWDLTLNVDFGIDDTKYKMMVVDVTHLCLNICDAVEYYYNNNKEKFFFEYHIISQEDLINHLDNNLSTNSSIVELTEKILKSNYIKIANDKLRNKGSDWRIESNDIN